MPSSTPRVIWRVCVPCETAWRDVPACFHCGRPGVIARDLASHHIPYIPTLIEEALHWSHVRTWLDRYRAARA